MPTQKHRLVAIYTPLGDEELVFYRGEIEEELGRPFCINVEMLSENDAISLDDLLGKNVTLRIETADDTRYFNGYITDFHQLPTADGFSRYGAVIRPWFWLLNLSENCRIFQEMSYPNIIKQVFNDLGFSDFEDKLVGNYSAIDYVVQFNETDFNFVSRLMEQEGIFYYFSHINGKHTLVLLDDNATAPSLGSVDYFPPDETHNQFNTEVITRWENYKKVRSSGIRLTDFDFEVPSKNLEAVSSNPTTPSMSALERFNYPGKYKERNNGNDYTRLLMERENVAFETKIAESNLRTLNAGAKFTLAEHYRDDQNKEYLITKIKMIIKSDEYTTQQQTDDSVMFQATFSAVPAASAYRSQVQAVKPKMQGPQTAIVVGKSGEEIWTDKYGRVKVLFHWDRYGKADETSSCWIRVSQNWAGKNWGHYQIPRIGQEVLVDFLEGDPDKPIIIGSVYNGNTMPPYTLPANATRSGIKTRSSKGGDGFNEIRLEDKKGEEQIFIHAEKNQDVRVKNDQISWVGNEQHTNVEKNRFNLINECDHTLVKKDRFLTVDGEVNNTFGKDFKQKTANNEHYTIGQSRNQKIGMNESVKAGQNFNLKAGMNYGINAGMNVEVKGGMNINLQAGMTLNLKAGAGFISIGPSGVMIGGPMVMINSGGSAGPASPGSPAAPSAPKKAEEAMEADDDKSGKQADAVKAKKVEANKLKLKPVKAQDYSPAAKVMQQAAESGTPFCEQCEASK